MSHLHLFFLYATIFLLSDSPQFQVEAEVGGFTVDLFHRDSPLSPFYNQSKTPSQLLNEAFQSSISRAKHFQKILFDQKDVESDVLPNGGNYVMKISIGTPPTETLASADTGSDLVWVQCLPCQRCYPQNVPIFDSRKSSTFQQLPCNSQPCQSFRSSSCDTSGCIYQISYLDRSSTTGTLAAETLSFRSTDGQVASFPKSVFGCGKRNSGTFNERTAGIVGLGAAPLSLISQLGSQIGKKFSYCLAPSSASSSSKLKFGKEATLTANGIVSTPVTSKPDGILYHLTLEGISVGERNVPSGQGQGNIIIDSGTTLTILEDNFYSNLEANIRQAIGANPVRDSSGTFNLCYRQSDSVSIPEMVFHFTGADLRLSPVNTFIISDGLQCLAIVPGGRTSIFGNVAQVNFQVGYDLDAGLVSFAPADCTKV